MREAGIRQMLRCDWPDTSWYLRITATGIFTLGTGVGCSEKASKPVDRTTYPPVLQTFADSHGSGRGRERMQTVKFIIGNSLHFRGSVELHRA